MNYSSGQIKKAAKEDEKVNKELIKSIKKRIPRDLDEIVHRAHEEAFTKIDCLSCANCCKSLGPRISDKDIERLSRYLKIRPAILIQSHLRVDEDGDYVFRDMPCPFLEADNKCSVYEFRPKACREYPHTDRKKFYQLLDLSLQNSYVCPAVSDILSELRLAVLNK